MLMNRKVANAFLRITLGALFVYTGLGKLLLGKGPADLLAKIFPFISGQLSVLLLGAVEFIAGLLLFLGLWTRFAAWVIALLFACFIVFGIAFGVFMSAGLYKDVILLAASLLLAAEGCRKWGIDAYRLFKNA